MSALWRGHLATPAQASVDVSSGKGRRSQADVLIGMLRHARARCRPLELPEIMAAGIAQYGARFNEIRARGFVVENTIRRTEDGRTLSRYLLTHDPERDGK